MRTFLTIIAVTLVATVIRLLLNPKARQLWRDWRRLRADPRFQALLKDRRKRHR